MIIFFLSNVRILGKLRIHHLIGLAFGREEKRWWNKCVIVKSLMSGLFSIEWTLFYFSPLSYPSNPIIYLYICSNLPSKEDNRLHWATFFISFWDTFFGSDHLLRGISDFPSSPLHKWWYYTYYFRLSGLLL